MQNQAAIVTGASSGIGQAICGVLLLKGYEVYGFGRNFQKEDPNMSQECFHAITMDLRKTGEVEQEIKKIRKNAQVKILVNNAGCAYYGLHEELNTAKIKEMVRINLELPLLLTNWLLRDLKKNQGFILNISSVTAGKASPHGCAYAATKSGLSGFSESLFEEARKYGVRVVDVRPDMTSTNLYRNADFTTDESLEARLEPADVAQVVSDLLELRNGVVMTQVKLQPRFHRLQKKSDEKSSCFRG